MRQIFVLLTIFFAQASWGWGTQGHMVVAQIGENNLSPKAKQAIKQILKGQSLASVANWADLVKSDSEFAHTKPWHFVDIPDGDDYTDIDHHEGDVVSAITEMVTTLKSNGADALSKENALKFLVHFVGDIHQPLHVGRPDDRGGNDVRIVFEGRNSNLHQLWDSLMIMKSPMDYAAYAQWLERSNAKELAPPYDIPSFAFSTIIAEDMAARSDIYSFSMTSQGPIQVSTSYYQKNVDLMNRQLLKGGKRLSELLNSIFR